MSLQSLNLKQLISINFQVKFPAVNFVFITLSNARGFLLILAKNSLVLVCWMLMG